MKNEIAKLNDLLRQTFLGGKVCLTIGVSSLPLKVKEEVLSKVRSFNTFNQGNDPYGEHDFGKVTHLGEDYFWKIELLPEGRVMTVMRVEEY
jgi:hypothetical protein